MRRLIQQARIALTAGSHNRSILKAAIVVGMTTAAVKLASLAKELVVASTFGRADALDAFLISFLIPSFAINVIGGSFNAALIPTFVFVRETRGKDAAQRLFSNIVLLSAGLLAVVSVMLLFVGPYLLQFLTKGFGAEKLELSTRLFYALLPILLINGLATTWGAVLNAGERFAWVSLASLSIPLVTLLALLLGGKHWGIMALTSGTVAGFALEAALVGWGLRRHGLSIVPRWTGMSDELKLVMKQFTPMVAGGVLMSSTLLVDNAMAAMLQPGSVAALSYGNRITALVTGLCATALGTAALPYFSKMVANGEWAAVKATLNFYLRFIFVTIVPLTVLLIFFSENIVALLFERGAFTRSDTELVGQVQAFFLLQLPFYIGGILLVRLISAAKANHILMWGTLISVIVNIAMNYVGMKYLGVAGIALSTSLVYLVAFGYLFLTLRRIIESKTKLTTMPLTGARAQA